MTGQGDNSIEQDPVKIKKDEEDAKNLQSKIIKGEKGG